MSNRRTNKQGGGEAMPPAEVAASLVEDLVREAGACDDAPAAPGAGDEQHDDDGPEWGA